MINSINFNLIINEVKKFEMYVINDIKIEAYLI